MKKLFTLIFVLMLGSVSLTQAQQNTQAQNNNTTAQKQDGPQITFKEDLHDFGKINEGVVAEYEFKFTNTGSKPLLITDVRPSCGCTTPSYTKEPIAPGQSGVIKVSYNSMNRPGTFTKSITVTTNVEGDAKVLFIKGEVAPSPNMQVDPNQSPVRLNNG